MYRNALLNNLTNSASRGDRRMISGAINPNNSAASSSASFVVPLTICGSVCSSSTAKPCTMRSGQNATRVFLPFARQVGCHRFGDAGINRGAHDDQLIVREKRNQLVEAAMNRLERRIEELIDRRADGDDDHGDAANAFGDAIGIEHALREHVFQERLGALLHEGHLARHDGFDGLAIDVEDANLLAFGGEYDREWEADVAAASHDADIGAHIYVYLLLADDRHPPACAESARCYLQDRGGLFSFEFGHADQLENLANGGFIKALGDDLFGRLRLFDV